jgi:hypothetical protein
MIAVNRRRARTMVGTVFATSQAQALVARYDTHVTCI